MTILRAATYCRYSSDQQRASSIVDQRRNCHKRAAAEGWKVSADFADAAISGTDNRRPQYLAMQQAAARKEFDVLLLDDLSRLARDSVEQETVIRRLEYQGLRIIAVSDGYDSESKSRKLQRGFKGLMNEAFLDDLRDKTHRGLSGQALKGNHCGGRAYGYQLKAIRDDSRVDAYGESVRVGTQLTIEPGQARIVAEIFELFASGRSCLMIARALNDRGVPSPGSSWRRVTRRSNGWMGSSIRVILRNPIYKGEVVWNTSRLEKHPDTKKRLRHKRDRSEWITRQDETLRIVSDEMFLRAQTRTKAIGSDDARLKSGGKPKYLLSGLLRCEACGANYIIANARGYGCSSFVNGGACKNGTLVRRDTLERVILGPIYDGLLEPKRVAKMATTMQRDFAEELRSRRMKADALPRQILDLDERIARLRSRLQTGDPDLSAQDLQAAIGRATAERRQLAEAQPEVKENAKLLAMLPKAAALYRAQIKEGLAGNERMALKARMILRDLIGPIRLAPEPDGSLWATYGVNPAALVKTVGTNGSGGRI